MNGRAVAWHVPVLNERRAGLRYRCLYPMELLRQAGVPAMLFKQAEASAYSSVIFDAWTLFPSVSTPAQISQLLELVDRLRQQGTRIVLDNCDNQFAATPNASWTNACEQLRVLAQQADVVLCCSEQLATVMQQECQLAERPRVVEDPIETSIRYTGDRWWRSLLSPRRKLSWLRHSQHHQALARERSRGITPLVWFGAHGNHFADGGMLDLLQVLPVLKEIALEHGISLTIISNHRGKFEQHFSQLDFPTHYLDWDRVTFLQALRLHDIALLPVVDNAFTRCKSANRLSLALHHGLNVVADPLPSYQRFANCSQLGRWKDGLQAYLGDAKLRSEHLRSGQALVQAHFGPQAITGQWLRALDLSKERV